MENQYHHRSPSSSGAAWGVLLILAGLFFLAARYLPVDVGQYGWPFVVILAGLTLLLVGGTSRSVSGLLVPGSIVTVVGLILAVQNAYGLWATWSYAWALVAPGSIGLGVALVGLARHDRAQAQNGKRAALVGLGLFVGFGAFFEGVVRISGIDWGPAEIVLPVILIIAGVVLLAFRLVDRRPAA